MPTFALSGRHARVFWSRYDTAALLNYSGMGNNFLLGADEMTPSSLVKNPVTGNAGQWVGFPYLTSVSFTVEGGVTPVTALGLDNPAAVEEIAIGLQDVTIECLLQAVDETFALFNMFKRVTDTNDPAYMHWPLLNVRVYLVGYSYYQGGLQSGRLFTWDIWSCIPRSISLNQPEGGAATLRVTLGGGYIFAGVMTGTAPAVSYNISKGILNVFEGRVIFYDDSNPPQPINTDLPLYISSLSIDINNTVNSFHTFLANNFSDAKFMRAVRLPRALMDGVQTITGSMTLFAPRDIMARLNINKLQRFGMIDILYYPYAGANAPSSVPSTHEFGLRIFNVKVIRSSVNLAPDRMVGLNINFQATHPTAEAWALI